MSGAAKESYGLLHRLPKDQRALIRQMGSRLFQQEQAAQQLQQSQTELHSQPTPEAVTKQRRAPVAVMDPPQEHVNPQALTNFSICTLPVLPSSSPIRLRAMELRPEAPARRSLLTSPKRRRANNLARGVERRTGQVGEVPLELEEEASACSHNGNGSNLLRGRGAQRWLYNSVATLGGNYEVL